MAEIYDVAVIGAGINGLSTVYHLADVQNLKVLLLQQFVIGHQQGSSHSDIRIIRTAYQNQIYLNLADEAKNFSWPELEKKVNEKLIFNNLFLLFGDDEQFQSFKKITLRANLPTLKLISGQQAQKLNPTLKLNRFKQVIADFNAGIIYARRTIQSLKKYSLQAGVTILQNTQIIKIIENQNYLLLKSTNGKEFKTKKLVITAGRWISRLIPQVNDVVKVIEQTITYLQFQDNRQNYQIGKYASYMWSEKSNGYMYYSLPSFGDNYVKFAHHDNGYDNETLSSQTKIQNIKKIYNKIYHNKLKNIQKVQKCYYTTTKTQQFIIDFIDERERILVTSTCSGHAFKFGPLVGKILSELIRMGSSTVKAYEDNKLFFSIYYNKGINLV